MRWYKLLQGIKKFGSTSEIPSKSSAKFGESHRIPALWEVVSAALEGQKFGDGSEILKCRPPPYL